MTSNLINWRSILMIITVPVLLAIAISDPSGAAGKRLLQAGTQPTAEGQAATVTPTYTGVPSQTVSPASDLAETDTPTPTPTSTGTATSTPTYTETATPTPTATGTSTSTPTSTGTATLTATATSTSSPAPLHLPLVILQPSPTPSPTLPPLAPELVLVCSNVTMPIPDNDPIGSSSSLVINDVRFIQDLDVRLDVNHPWTGDLSFQLIHMETRQTVKLIDQPGVPATTLGCNHENIGAILDDEITLPVENQCLSIKPAIQGIFLPQEPLAAFDGEAVQGTWILTAIDHAPNDTGKVKNWCLALTLGNPPPPPTPAPPPPNLPTSHRIYNVTGAPQQLPLDCESRVAVDWANYFGVKIGERTFFDRLPISDNPDAGFVGDVYGTWGQIPPYPYGVHAEPVAALLRKYGLAAYAHRPLSWDEARAEVAADHPVFVWTIGDGSYNGIPIYYRSSDDHLTIVAHYEHVVMVIGYSADSVTVLDGGTVKRHTLTQFLRSWSALGNMAITTQP